MYTWLCDRLFGRNLRSGYNYIDWVGLGIVYKKSAGVWSLK
jgi:hypothetical protein